MDNDFRASRQWGWQAWLEEEVLPKAAPAGGRSDVQLWILTGAEESGCNDMVAALNEALKARSSQGEDVVVLIAREPGETAIEWQSRVAMLMTGDPPVQTGGGASLTTPPFSEMDPYDLVLEQEESEPNRPSSFIICEGESLPIAWWRFQFPRWLVKHATGCLFVVTSSPGESIIEAFRQAGGSIGGIHQRMLGPWEESKIEAWRARFMPHDHRPIDALIKLSRGGWPGYLWALYEQDQAEARSAGILNHLRGQLDGMSKAERDCLYAAALAPVPSRDFVEVLLHCPISPEQWEAYVVRWKQAGFLNRDAHWASNSLPVQVKAICQELGGHSDSIRIDTRSALSVLYGYFPEEATRRLVVPVSIFDHIEREALINLLGDQGSILWDRLLDTPGVCSRGNGPRPLNEVFLGALRVYAEDLPGGIDQVLSDKLQSLWKMRLGEFRAETSKLADKRKGLIRRLEKARADMVRHEKSVHSLRKKYKQATAPKRAKPTRAMRKRFVSSADNSRQILGVIGIIVGIGWIYLSFIQHNAFQIYPTFGGLSLLVGGFFAASASREAGQRAPHGERIPIVRGPSESDILADQLNAEQSKYVLSRDFHDQVHGEIKQLSAQIRLYEEAQLRPYLRT